jgi:hypothetical protein
LKERIEEQRARDAELKALEEQKFYQGLGRFSHQPPPDTPTAPRPDSRFVVKPDTKQKQPEK